MHKAARIVLVTLCGLSTHAGAVEGLAVSVHWSGTNDNLLGGYGDIWTHTIQDTRVTGHTRIYSGGDARCVRFDRDATRVAFIRQDGKICVLSTSGGLVDVIADGHREACLDWPDGDWVYFTLGGYSQSGSEKLRRANVGTMKSELFASFNAEGSPVRSWRFGIASNGKRAAYRSGKSHPNPNYRRRIFAYDMTAGDGRLSLSRATELNGYSCGSGILADGEHIMDGWGDHKGMDVRRWSDMKIVKSFSWSKAASWGGPDSGTQHNRNAGSSNSDRWMCVHLGWGTRGQDAANLVLFNWKDEQRIVVTENAKGSRQFDSYGDFRVGAVTGPPNQLPAVSIVQPAAGATFTAGTALTIAASASDSDGSIARVEFFADNTKLGQDTSAPYQYTWSDLPEGSHTLTAVAIDDKGGASTSASVAVTVNPAQGNVPPVVSITGPADGAGFTVGETATITVDASDVDGTIVKVEFFADGKKLAEDTLAPFTYTWSNLSAGSHTLTAVAMDDAGMTATSKEITVTVAEEQSITLTSPKGGEVWSAGTGQFIRWSAKNLDDVSIYFSADDGRNWEPVGNTDDTQAAWGNYPWTVPDQPAPRCRIRISGYFGEAPTTSGPFEITSGPDATPPAVVLTAIGVSGRIDDPIVAAVILNGSPVSLTAGAFSAESTASPWPMTLSIAATDGAGNTSSRVLVLKLP